MGYFAIPDVTNPSVTSCIDAAQANLKMYQDQLRHGEHYDYLLDFALVCIKEAQEIRERENLGVDIEPDSD